MKFLALLFVLVGCAQQPAFKKSATPVVFIHGSHFSVDVWRDVLKDWPQERPLLTLAIPDRGQTHNMPLQEAAKFACGALAHPSVIVAHSFGGMVVQQMVSVCPEKLKQIIYVTAMTALPGEDGFSTFSKSEQEYYSKGVRFDKTAMKPLSREQFMAMMAGEGYRFDASWPAIYTEYSGPTKVKYKLEDWLAIPKAYVIATQDQLILPGTQQVFLKKGRIEITREIHSGHLPMVTHPKELTKILAELSVL